MDKQYKPYVEPEARKGIKYDLSPGKYLELLRESLGIVSKPKTDDTTMTTESTVTKSPGEPKEQIEHTSAKTEPEQKTEKVYERESSVVSDGRFDFGVVIGVLEEKISYEAYNLTKISEHNIIVTTYRNMCQNIKTSIAGRLSQNFRALEDRRRFLEDRCRFLDVCRF
ncbi:1342_t:CDS:2 [Racocetra fulgida]|uniref:1342_t:CDS:1 n=1 Tax=Racocetra fulgida TaxID=60492 RepID=A0A9N9AIW5_9GLOM|nr:1342_t:CDS:2 [Racocetra fulgida]